MTVPLGTLIGLGLGWLIGGGSGAASMASGAVIGLFVTAGFVTFDAIFETRVDTVGDAYASFGLEAPA